jgi:teichoic acid transport system permease protein
MSSDHSVVLRERENQFTTIHHVYEPHRAGVPPLRPYITELWRRREFASESSRATMRSANTTTVFGQVWLVLNPLLLAAVYFFLVQVLSGGHHGMDYFARLTAGLFSFYFVSGSMATGAGSVVGGGKLLLNTAFPRLLMPFSAVRTAFFRFLPTVPVYLFFHILAGKGFSLATLCALPFLFLLVVFSMGLASFFATLQVYFRDTTSFMPYVTRIWLYLSPVLWTLDSIPHKFKKLTVFLEILNPLFSLLGGFTEALVDGRIPRPSVWIIAAAWSFGTFIIGSLYFMSREREFAVRL